MGGARNAIDDAKLFLKQYGNYRVYESLILAIQDYLRTGSSSLRITQNLLSNDGATVRSELESWYFSYFSTVLPIIENFQGREIQGILKPLEQATASFAGISLIKEDVRIEDIKEARFSVVETPNRSTEFKAELFHNDKMYELRLLTSFKQWRNPEIIEAIRSTLFLLQNISKQDQLRNITFHQSQRLKEGEVARRIAHDIRSPLAALQVAVSSIGTHIPDYGIIKSSTQRIEDIANSLTRKRDIDVLAKKEKVLVKSFIDSLVATKRFEYQRQRASIEIQYTNQAGAQYIDVNELELSRTMSNIINNSIEAYKDGGPVKITVDSIGGSLLIQVEDHGCGIDQGYIERVFDRDFSVNKKGSGLGLFYAKEFIESNGGSIKIESKMGCGTTVNLVYPVSIPPEWIKTTLFLDTYAKVVIVDDFVPNTDIMKEKISSHCPLKQIITFSDLASFQTYLNQVDDMKDTFFIIDYDFVNSSQTGIDVILSSGLSRNSVLATHHYEDEGVIRSCKENSVKIVPKIIFSDIRIVDEKPHVFVIDDEKYFLKALKNKLEKKFDLHLFENGEGLLEKAREIKGTAFFFVDRNFAELETNGEKVISSLKSLGKDDLYNISEDVSFLHPNAVKIRKKEIEQFLT